MMNNFSGNLFPMDIKRSALTTKISIIINSITTLRMSRMNTKLMDVKRSNGREKNHLPWLSY